MGSGLASGMRFIGHGRVVRCRSIVRDCMPVVHVWRAKMGISIGPFHFLLRCKINYGRTLVLGRQELRLPASRVAIKEVLHELRPDIDVDTFYGERYADSLFLALGATELSYMDASDYEGARLIHDLNQPVPKEWWGQYDTVIDGGTLEHVFHIPNALASIAHLLKVGGTFISMTTANNWLGHGFYQFSPELMFRFCDMFGFEAEKIEFYVRMGDRSVQIIPQEDPKKLGRRVEYNPTPSNRFDLMTHAKKLMNREPSYLYQSDYSTAWTDSNNF